MPSDGEAKTASEGVAAETEVAGGEHPVDRRARLYFCELVTAPPTEPDLPDVDGEE